MSKTLWQIALQHVSITSFKERRMWMLYTYNARQHMADLHIGADCAALEAGGMILYRD